MRIAVLGPLAVHTADGEPIDIGGIRLRMLLARLALEGGRAVSVDGLTDGLWGAEPPADAAGALQASVSRLRKALPEPGAVELVAGGYRLGVQAEDVDAFRFEELLGRGRRELAAGKPEAAADTLDAALALWRGPALADLLAAPFAELAASRLNELRADAEEEHFDALLQAGRHSEILADLESAGARRPLSERLAVLRIRALAASGRQSDALAVYERVRESLGEELGVDPSAELQQVHLALLRGELHRPVARSAPMASRIPLRLTSFVGRERELERLALRLTDARLVTLTGPGGAGKTRLAVEAVARHRAAERGRVWFVPLAGASDADEVIAALLGAIGARDARGPEGAGATPMARVIESLDLGEAIVVLDNCEHVIDAVAELIEQLLAALPDLRVVATSREALAITGESLLYLGPLSVPGDSVDVLDPDPAALAEVPSVRLFLDRAAAVSPEFVLDMSTAAAVAEICRRLDGLPLALELAAATLRSMSVQQVAQRLDDRFRLLESGSRTALPHQRTLLALVDWSWELLTEPERTLARRLAMFPAGATLEALESVCADSALPAEDVLAVVRALVEKSMVQLSGESEPRYRMLETIRDYAAGQLARSGDTVADAFLAYHLQLAATHEPSLRTRDQLDAMARFDAEHDNLLAALRIALDGADAERAAEFVAMMFWYWGIRGMSTHFDTYLNRLRQREPELPERTTAAFALIRLFAGTPVHHDVPVLDLIATAEAAGALEFHPAVLLLAPRLAYAAGDPALGDRLLARASSSPDPWVRANAHSARAELGDRLTPAESRAAALAEFESVGDRWGLGMTLLAIGQEHSLHGRSAEAIAAFERGVALSAELNAADLFHCRAALISERMRSGDLPGAWRDLEAARRQAQELGDRRTAADILFSVAEWHRRGGDPAAADAAIDRLEPLTDRLQLPADVAAGLLARARMANRLAAGDPAGARALWPQALAACLAWGTTDAAANAAELLAQLRAAENTPESAATALGMSEAIRGVFDAGEPMLAALTADLIAQLGANVYKQAYQRGAEMPRTEAIARLG
ncbi:AfsR/SARP family transcriptional regulator [Nocardia cyriacigeorgica]|uniref:AfsR/SARP family transcriptional regulator n=1 Tax=Nocardia cyriacigeorgica TaxID=135487 RepID=A0A5R8PK74_9NOCA|nr:BTAD domain-containing putative transcriptional regulator [Nocardia cyriacigeorgica]TLG17640.1 AfsR/SARP family transcriptional regulator [Nocardia cyriacigeorgica]